jgi:hypothetical protein
MSMVAKGSSSPARPFAAMGRMIRDSDDGGGVESGIAEVKVWSMIVLAGSDRVLPIGADATGLAVAVQLARLRP